LQPAAQPEAIGPSNSLMFMSGVASGFLVLIVEAATEEACTTACRIFFSPALAYGLSMESHRMKIYAQNNHFYMVHCTISVEP